MVVIASLSVYPPSCAKDRDTEAMFHPVICRRTKFMGGAEFVVLAAADVWTVNSNIRKEPRPIA